MGYVSIIIESMISNGMNINWFGHSCFRIEAKEGSILIDPFSKDIGIKPPKIKDDVVLISHNHYDHSSTENANEDAFVISTPGEYEKNGIAVQGIQSFHDQSEGKERGYNTIYVIKAEDLTLCHMGDYGELKLSDKQIEQIGDVDILMIPVGGKYTLNAREAVEAISQIGPKVIIPMHYKVKDLNIDIEGPEKFVKELGLSPEKVDKYKITKKTLPAEEMKLVMFELA
ncbi:MAG: Zn-dependent hydrolase [Candidatus Yanofskybacteria bacterium GW2011_GWE1_40_10]|nr:MAG: Zn-dependent hydrolase [Candidatus Yanofskybacteria bacterium GW2011_GWE1_40_10]